jgi:hypothetical protein
MVVFRYIDSAEHYLPSMGKECGFVKINHNIASRLDCCITVISVPMLMH